MLGKIFIRQILEKEESILIKVACISYATESMIQVSIVEINGIDLIFLMFVLCLSDQVQQEEPMKAGQVHLLEGQGFDGWRLKHT